MGGARRCSGPPGALEPVASWCGVTTHDPTNDPRFLAAVKLLERTGAKTFRIGYSDEDDGPPTVWYACATWQHVTAGPTVHSGGEAAAALDPVQAVLRLCEQVIDGGECTHCRRPTIFEADMPMGTAIDHVLDDMGCVYSWDPELATFRRSCE